MELSWVLLRIPLVLGVLVELSGVLMVLRVGLGVNSEGIACSILSTAIIAVASAVSFLFLNALSCFELLLLLTCKYSPKQVIPIVVWFFLLMLLCVVFRDRSLWTGVSGVVVKLTQR